VGEGLESSIAGIRPRLNTLVVPRRGVLLFDGNSLPEESVAERRSLLEMLRERGQRMTPQRQLILEAVQAIDGHISAEAVHARVAGRFPQVNISTVYRTLELLQDIGLVTHTHFDDGVAQYHRAEEGLHQHLVCRACGSEQELDLAVLEPLGAVLNERYGFEADLAHFALVGLCRACAGRPQTVERHPAAQA
jgi:Fur family ferric uptake transcriptional regulator